LDLNVSIGGVEEEMPRFVAGTGFATLDRIYTGAQTRPIEALGGSCANVLVSLAMLGHDVAPILSLGLDATGAFLLDEMRRAGCVTQFVSCELNAESPVTVEYLDIQHAQHVFSSTCPETNRPFPSYKPIAESNADRAKDAIREASIFYVDRLSEITLLTMIQASSSGGLVFFEPNSIEDMSLFREALPFIDILKVSEDARADLDLQVFEPPAYFITTYGSDGLVLEMGNQKMTLPSLSAPRLIDTCGAGDMVTTGLIHVLMEVGATRQSIQSNQVCSGLLVGQQLAALNCAFVGARGLFHAFGGAEIRKALGSVAKDKLDVARFEPYAGYLR
jgi:fructokinase